ncbi:MAG: SpoIIE family protein phosphatase [bacterium]|nr:SpoIIE family protein phosphatase [bacterium]
MNKRKTRTLIPVVIIVIIAALISFMSGGSLFENRKKAPLAVRGILDLKTWNFETDGHALLSGEWEFYWKSLLVPADFDSNTLINNPVPTGFMTLPRSWDGYPVNGKKISAEGYATFRLTVKNITPHRLLAFRFHDIGLAYRVFANGREITSVGKVGKEPHTMTPAYFPHVAEFSGETGELSIIIQASNFHRDKSGIWDDIHLGPVNKIHQQRDKSLAFELFLFGSLFIMALYHFGLYLLRKKDKSPLYFAACCLFISLFTLTTGERYLAHLYPDLSWELFFKLLSLSFFLSVPVFAMFLRSLFPDEFSEKVLQVTQIVTVLASIIVIITSARVFSYIITAYQVFTGMLFLYIIFLLVLAAIRKRDGASVFLFGFFILFLTFVNDVLHDNAIIYTSFFVPFGLFVFIFSQAFFLSTRFSRALSMVENLTHELEDKSIKLEDSNVRLTDKVIKRTEQMLRAKTEVETVMDKLESINENLLQANKDLEGAQRTMKLDMDMAQNVQKNYLSDEAPGTENWETALMFKPMAGVSGDFFDFYLSEDELEVVGLFDVSGHGISSALITMIAKSILVRIFNENKGCAINLLLQEANNELIRELGNVDNYLTGVMVQLYDTYIECVNAAHTDILHKKKSTKEIEIIGLQNKDYKGNFLSIPMLKSEYDLFRFNIEPGDSILLYTDCLVEGFNKNRESYEVERLVRAFKKVPGNSSAQEQLDLILEDFYRHIGNEKLNDDLTVILLKNIAKK